MRKPDFDFSKYVQIPDRWIENALNIPNTAKKAPKIFPIRRFVTAASIVLVTAIGISLFFLFANKSTIPVAPVITVAYTETVSETSPVPTAPTQQSSVPTDGTFEPTKPLDTAAPTQTATDNVTSAATAPTAPTADSQTPSQRPTEAVSHPTQRATEKPTKPTQKPVTPTQKPVTPTQKPTSAPVPTTPSATQKPTKPPETESPGEDAWIIIEDPSESSWGERSDVMFIDGKLVLSAGLTNQTRLNERYVYCRIANANGTPIGDTDYYSKQHRILVDRNRYSVSYIPEDHGLTLPSGKYVFWFYDKNGKVFHYADFRL